MDLSKIFENMITQSIDSDFLKTLIIITCVTLNPIPYGLFEAQLWGPKNSKTQIFQTDKVISFHLSS